MISLLLAATMTVSPNVLRAPGVRYFPSEYFDTNVERRLQEQVLERWPGPSELVRLWQSGDLNVAQQLALLLGASAYHDRQMLPVYREALQTTRPRVRQAAAYGYRTLIGDTPPNVSAGVSAETAQALTRELDAVAKTLREHSLVEMWLVSALAATGQSPPDWNGVVFRRTSANALRSVERVADPFDLPSLMSAYELAGAGSVRRGLLRLVEGLSLQKFIVMPEGNRAGWGRKQYEEAAERFDRWSESFCDQDVEKAVIRGFEAMGFLGVSPFEAQGCDAWLRILDRGENQWWPLAARQIYICGGPAVELSILKKDTEANADNRKRIKAFYGLGRNPR